MEKGMILHSDLNCFYASVEVNENPSLRGKKVAVCGSTEDRHGIVLTATYPAKRCGVKTGMANWQALAACPDLIVVAPHYDLYLKYSRAVRRIYRRYADDIEPFGMDENWLWIPWGTPERDGQPLADAIRRDVYEETGLTVSVGVSFSKIFAKLGSDLKKPDATTVITRANFRQKLWPLPVSNLLYVGPATTRKLAAINIRTIGDLAQSDAALIGRRLGKNGLMVRAFALGCDGARVQPASFVAPIKSVGHGATCVCDLCDNYEIWRALYALTQDIGHRLRACGLSVRGISLTVRDNALMFRQYQMPLSNPTQSPLEIAQVAYRLFEERYPWTLPVRALTVTGIRLEPADAPWQTDLFGDARRRLRQTRLDDAIDALRGRFGERAVMPAVLMGDNRLAQDRCETVPMPAAMYR